MWDSFSVVNCVGPALIGWSRNPIFFKILYAFNVLSKLCKHFPAKKSCILSLSYYSQFLASKGAKDFSIQFSSTVLYFNNLSVEEENFFFCFTVIFCFVKRQRATKELSEICFLFTSFSNISNSSSFLRFIIFKYFFLFDRSLWSSRKVILQTCRYFIYMLYIQNAHISIATDSSNHAILLKHLDVFYFPNYLLYSSIYVHKLEKT